MKYTSFLFTVLLFLYIFIYIYNRPDFAKWLKMKTLSAFAIKNSEKLEQEINDLADYSLKSNVDLSWMINGICCFIFQINLFFY